MEARKIAEECEKLFYDLEFTAVREWKARTGGRVVGYLPTYVPREVIHAAGALSVGLFGGGDKLEIIKGDAFYQSYICHMPRSTLELGLSGRLDFLDVLLSPSLCDVVRNLSGVWQLQFPNIKTKYIDMPQNFDQKVGGRFFISVMKELAELLESLGCRPVTNELLRESIVLYNENRRLVDALYDYRAEAPHNVPTAELYVVLRASLIQPVEESNRTLAGYLAAVKNRSFRPLDNVRVVVVGSFCEQPPLNLIKTLEKSGCYIVDDDFIQIARWFRRPIAVDGDAYSAVSEAFLSASRPSSSIFEGDKPKSEDLVQRIRDRKAEGVIFAAPSFCDPALLDLPFYQEALDRLGISYTQFQFSENTGQFQTIKEQTGTFSDSIKLWSEA
ncbi:MAG: benzoyl-CoA reductase subunit C [Deltaproteobacteria bacterium]|jgi:benzoyl-CoA reductase subunit C|nr:benzoyl-CoA reductase subunit C [Deltaproteobacteria bacterium]MDA8308700.1 benzoyl-CoA reductase subunit C [Deltaproteobacteria bacterium]